MLALSDILKNSKRYGVNCQHQTKAVHWRVFASQSG
jgi:hypothetical protein